ncbi:outer membrane beta-barrel protein [Marinimicrobium sp. LS-A18]|uniref:outer membrane beta-barrel protein n=1 Tax=Marinimicrobium sp. LS-A18 TaxID=1381596 RepID=UPI0004AFEDF7|nr:outer membrane beta-barrel protein [Marinimicrobium sp. LS-A18]
MEINMKKVILASALVCAAGVVQADQRPQWNQVSVAYQSADVEGETVTGFGLGGSALLSENIFVAGAFSRLSDDVELFGDTLEMDLNTVSFGLGFRHGLSVNTDLFAIVSYEDIEVDAAYMGESGSASDNGYGLTGGFRSMLSESFEISGSLGYVNIDDESETSVAVGADYFFTDTVSIGLGHAMADDVDTTSISLSVYF